MKARAARPYGSWPSAIRSGAVAEASLRLSQPHFDTDVEGEWLYWLEGRPEDEEDVTRIHVAMIEELLTPPEN